MADLPRLLEGPHGLVTEGASPDLLRQLLDLCDRELRQRARPVYDSLRPGLPADVIKRAFARYSLEPNEEAIAWWEWHDGLTQMTGFGLRIEPLPLEAALKLRTENGLGLERSDWNPNWVRVAGTYGGWSMALDFKTTASPAVRTVDHELDHTTQDEPAERQMISLCTPVVMWITQLQQGWSRFDTSVPGNWIVDWEPAPPSWRNRDALQ
jgi:hypothetical protein